VPSNVTYASILSSPLATATAVAVAVAAARHSPSPQQWSLRGFIVVIVIVTAVTTIFPPLFCNLFGCCACSVIVSFPLPHLVVAILPTASAIVFFVVVVAAACHRPW